MTTHQQKIELLYSQFADFELANPQPKGMALEARNKVIIDGHLNAALDSIMRQNGVIGGPDAMFNILGELSGKAIDIALSIAGNSEEKYDADNMSPPLGGASAESRAEYWKQRAKSAEGKIQALQLEMEDLNRPNPATAPAATSGEQGEEQEPVAYGVPNSRPTERQPFIQLLHSKDGCQYPELLVPLYTHPAPSAQDALDALRYRHLANFGVPDLCACIDGMPNYIGEVHANEAKKKLDDAIDADMRATEAGGVEG